MAAKKPKITIKAIVTTPGQTKITGSMKKPSMVSSGGGSVKATRTKPTVKFYPETKESMEKMKKAPSRNKTGKASPGKSMIAPAAPKNKYTQLPKVTGKTKSVYGSIIGRASKRGK